MRAEVHLKKVRGNEILKRLVERKIQKVDQLLHTFNPDLKNIKLVIEKYAKKPLYKGHIVLSLPTGTITIDKHGYSPIETVSKAFKTLIQEIQSHKEKLKREDEYKRKIKPAPELAEIVFYENHKKSEGNEKKRTLLDKISNKLHKYVFYAQNYLLALEEEYQVNLNGVITPEEIVDAAILDAFDEAEPMDNVTSFEHKIFKHINNRIEARAHTILSEQKDIPLEARAEVIQDDEVYEYYQPDAYWHVEDIFEDPNEILPEELIENQEMLDTLKNLMKELPAKYRQLFYLYYIQGYNTQDIKAILNQDMDQIEKDLGELNQILRDQVEDEFLEEFIRD